MGKRFWVGLRHFFVTTLALIVVAVVMMVVGFFAVRFVIGSGDEVLVPNLIGQDSGMALEILLTADLRPFLPIGEDHHDDIEAGRIMEQSPLPGTRVKRGRAIRLVKSLGSQQVMVPRLVGLDMRSAEWELRRSELKVGQVLQIHHEQVEEGVIIAQEPPPQSRARKDLAVNLLLSQGVPARTLILPDVRGRRAAEVRPELERMGFKNIREEQVETPGRAPGTIIGQHPRPGYPLLEDQEVVLAVSSLRTGQGKVKYRFYSFWLPRALGPGMIEVVMLDDMGLRTVLQQRLKRGGRLEFIERTVGQAALVIYQDGRRILEEFFPMD